MSAMFSKPRGRRLSLTVIEQALRFQMAAGLLSSLIQRELEFSMGEKAREPLFQERLIMLQNLVSTVHKAYLEGRINRRMLACLLDIFLSGALEMKSKRKKRDPSLPQPLFLTISPTRQCNLRCKGCYAASGEGNQASLEFEIVDRILTEKKERWGAFFTVISGGEPLIYRDGDKTVFDLWAGHPDQFFLVYTNGTLITKEVARKISALGNVTPALSVEGFEKETDERRGPGIYKKVLQAMENLREAGVLFGVSMTATRSNADLLLSPEMINFWMDQQGAAYAWLFQYMPIGRAFSLELMITPEQRLRLYERTRELIHHERRFIVDFWNNGPLSRGCISAGRDWGYFYIDWNGNLAPCVFVPYATHNIREIYQQGKNLDHALQAPFFQAIRNWQKEYGYGKPLPQIQNWIAPCLIRDNHRCFCDIRDSNRAAPLDEWAEAAAEDENYRRGLIEYGQKFKELSRPLWEKFYLPPSSS